MPTRKFVFELEGPKRLELSWKWMFRNVDVRVDGKSVGVIPNRGAMKEGCVFQLPDGSMLSVKLGTGFGGGIELLRDGVALPGSDTVEHTQVKVAAQILYFIAALNALLGA